MSTARRRSVGALGEQLAEAHLVRAGYRVLERNYRSRYGELDLIAAGRGCLVFCEVRARVARAGGSAPAFGGPLDSIGPAKRRQLRRMARQWLAGRRAVPAADTLRFDAIGVIVAPGGRLISLEHVENAF